MSWHSIYSRYRALWQAVSCLKICSNYHLLQKYHHGVLECIKHLRMNLPCELKGLAMIFAGQENTFIIFRSKEINIYFKTNNKVPINLLNNEEKQGFW